MLGDSEFQVLGVYLHLFLPSTETDVKRMLYNCCLLTSPFVEKVWPVM